MDILDVHSVVLSSSPLSITTEEEKSTTLTSALPELSLASRLFRHPTVADGLLDAVLLLLGAPPAVYALYSVAQKTIETTSSFFEDPPELSPSLFDLSAFDVSPSGEVWLGAALCYYLLRSHFFDPSHLPDSKVHPYNPIVRTYTEKRNFFDGPQNPEGHVRFNNDVRIRVERYLGERG